MKNMLNAYVALALLILCVGLGPVDTADAQVTKVKIGSIHGQLRYDKVFFAVKPSATVEITLVNVDEMIHNWVLCKPRDDVTQKVAALAIALGAKALDQHMVPKSDLVLAYTKLAYPNKTVKLTFKAPGTEADYPYVCTVPGHAVTMRGVMRVTKDPANAKAPAHLLAKPPVTIGRNYKLEKLEQPMVMRVTIKNTPSRSIAVGLPKGTHYMIDSVNGQVIYGWTGGFLDVGPDRRGRGGRTCNILGKKFDVGANGCPIRFGSATRPGKVQFLGYRRIGTPQFAFKVDGTEVRQTVNAAEGGGLIYSFRLPKVNKNVFFVIKPDSLALRSSAGEFKNGVLRVRKDQATAFTVTVKPAK